MKEKTKSPWAWIPSLYLAQGLPYVAVMTISVIMYKRLGVSNSNIALYTSWLYLPWVIKPLWSPFVDLLKTKRWWIVVMQVLVGAGFGGIAFSIPVPFFFQATLAFFWLLAFSSATHDIAADGFYMLALNANQQAKYVGIRSTFYRIATIFGQGILIILAGFLESTTGLQPAEICIKVDNNIKTEVALPPIVYSYDDENAEATHFILSSNEVVIGTNKIDKKTYTDFVNHVEELNFKNGFTSEKRLITENEQTAEEANLSRFEHWIKTNFGEQKQVSADANKVGNIGIVAITLAGKPQNAKDVILNTGMNQGDASISLIRGERLVFNENNWNQPAYMIFQIDTKLDTASDAQYKGLSGNIPLAWSVTFFVLAALFLLFSFYHKFSLPKPETEGAESKVKASTILKEFQTTFKTFFQKPHALTALFFMLTFRFSEAQLLKLINPFLLDSKDLGGLGLTTGEVGFVYGTIGIIGLVLGGIIGGLVASKGGLKKWLWPMTLSMLLTILTFVYLGFAQPDSLIVINVCVFIEQFGYGFGFTAYMLYLIYYSEGKYKTAHYAICTGFMALGMMIPGMFAGWLQELLGYKNFFIWVMICSSLTVLAVALLKIDSNYGKAQPNKIEEEEINEEK